MTSVELPTSCATAEIISPRTYQLLFHALAKMPSQVDGLSVLACPFHCPPPGSNYTPTHRAQAVQRLTGVHCCGDKAEGHLSTTATMYVPDEQWIKIISEIAPCRPKFPPKT